MVYLVSPHKTNIVQASLIRALKYFYFQVDLLNIKQAVQWRRGSLQADEILRGQREDAVETGEWIMMSRYIVTPCESLNMTDIIPGIIDRGHNNVDG